MKRSTLLGTATPINLLLVLALLWGVGLLAWVILQEPPQAQLVGTVTVLATGNRVPGAEVLLRGVEGPAKGKVFRQKADPQGRFAWMHLPIGQYEIEASAKIQYLPPLPFELREGERKKLLLELKPRKTFLRLLSPQHVFTSREPVRLGVHGFVETDSLTLEIARYDLLRALTGDAASRERVRHWEGGEAHPPEEFLQPQPSHRVPITEKDPEGIFTQYIDVPVKEPGAYFVTVRAGRQSQRVGLLVSDLALVIKEDGQQMLVFAADLETGAPQPGVAVTVYPPHASPAERRKPGEGPPSEGGAQRGMTDRRGLFFASVPPHQSGQFTVLGQRGNHFSVASFSAGSPSENQRLRAYLYTERPVYRPGHTVHFKGILRQRRGKENGKSKIESGKGNLGTGNPEAAGNLTGLGPLEVPPPQPVTVEARDGRGHLIWRGSTRSNEWGSFGGQFDIPKEAATGYFDLVALVGGEEHRGQFVVSAYRKPEYEVKLSSVKPYYLPGEKVRFELEARYYFGTPVADAEVTFTVRRHPTFFRPRADEEPSPWEELFAEESEGYGEWLMEKETRTDAQGRAVFTFNPRRLKKDRGDPVGPPDDPAESPEEWEYTVEASVSDASRKYVFTEASAIVTPGEFYVEGSTDSYLAAPGQPVTVRFTVHDYHGNPKAQVPLKVTARRAEWGEDPQGQWKRQVVEASGKALKLRTDARGEAVFQFTPEEEGEWLVRALATDRRKNRLGTSLSLYVWQGEGERLPGYHYGALELTLDRKQYRVGDTARAVLNLKNPSGTALLTVEGEQLYEARLLPLRKNSEVARVPVQARYLPNAFVAAARVREKRLEQRSALLKIEAGERLLQVEVIPDKTTARPREPITYTLRTTADGKPVSAEVSLAVVDEALYAIRKDHPEGLIQAFYAEQYNRVNTYFSSPEYYLQEGKDEGGVVRKHFPDTAFWKPDLVTGADGTTKVTVTLPDTLTTWRATALAHTRDTAVGFGTAKVVSRLDFQVRLETPRFVTQRDQALISAIVHNDTDRAESVTVELQGVAVGTEARGGAVFQTAGPARVKGKVPAHGQRRFDWRIRALSVRPNATLRVSAQAGSGWKDTVQQTLPIVPYALVDRSSRSGELLPGTVTETVKVPADLLPEVSELTVSVSPSIAGAVLRSLDTLADYPYGCVEQTMSRFLPSVLVSQAWRKLNWPIPDRLKKPLPDMVAQGLLRLYNFQHGDGGWGWWEYDSSDLWMTAYVLYGLQECRRAGFEVDGEALDRGGEWLQEELQSHPPYQAWDSDEAFGLYVLGRAGQEVRSLLSPKKKPTPAAALGFSIFSEPDSRAMVFGRGLASDEALALVALALQESGHGQEAQPLAGKLWDHASETAHDLHWGSLETTAWALRAVLRAGVFPPENPALPKAIHWLMLQWDGNAWVSTRSTALTIAALLEYLQVQRWTPPQATVRLTVNGKAFPPATLTPESLRDPEVRWKIPATELHEGENTLRLACQGQGQLYYTVAFQQYRAVEEMPQRLSAVGFTVERRYAPLSKDYLCEETTPSQPLKGAVSRGTVLQGEVILRVEEPVQYLVVEEPLPAGCEVMERGHLEEWEWEEAGYWWAQRDVRDEKIAFFIEQLEAGTHTLFYTLRAELPGTYRVLPTRAEGMYEPEVHSTGGESVIEIRE